MLLGALKHEREKQELDDGDLILQRTSAAPKKVQTGATIAPAAEPQRPKAAQAPLLKKGFLQGGDDSKRPSLYPEGGSSEGQGGDKGGVYQRLMNRCQVVDTRNMTPAQQHEATQQQQQQRAPRAPVPTRDEMMEMEKLLGQADDEWSSSAKNSAAAVDDGGDFSKALEEMSKMLVGSLDIGASSATALPVRPPSQVPVAKPAGDLVVAGRLYSQGCVKVEESEVDGCRILEILVSGLIDLDFGKNVTIDVGKSEVKLAIRGEVVSVVHQRLSFDSSSASAVSKKKKQELRVKVRLV